jgi:succinoglycan biosynthesis transport protein ExoP
VSAAEQEKGLIVDTKEIVWKAKRYKWLALLPIVGVLCAAFLYLNVAPTVYESSVVISMEDPTRVSEGMERLVRPSAQQEDLIQKMGRVRSRVLNRTFLTAISDRLGLGRDPKLVSMSTAAARKYPGITPEEYATRIAVSTLAKRINVLPVGSTYIRLAVKDPSPEQARRLATAVGEGLIEETRKSELERTQARGEFSQDQIAVERENLRRVQDAYRAAQERVVGTTITTGPVDPGNVEAVRELADAADKEADQVSERIRSDKQTWAGRMGSTRMPDLRTSRTAQLETRLAGLEASYGVAAARNNSQGDASGQAFLQQIGAARQELLSEYENAAGSLSDNIPDDARQIAAGVALDRSILISLRARKGRLQSMVGSYYSKVRSAPASQMELDGLKAEVQKHQDLLATLEKEAASSRISEAMETSQLSFRIEVVEPPALPLKPVWPDRLKVLAGALLLGPLFSVGIILGAERVGAILRTVEQAEEEIGTKVIGTIPRIEGWSRPGSFLENNWAPLSILAIVILTALVSVTYTSLTSSSRHGATPSGELRR